MESTSDPTQNDIWIYDNRSSLPHSFTYGAIGYNNISDVIYLLGGKDSPNHLVRYLPNKKPNNIEDYGDTYLTQQIWGFGQFYTQIDDIVWMIHFGGQKFNMFNVDSLQFVYNPKFGSSGYIIPHDVQRDGCLASVTYVTEQSVKNSYLIIIGGNDGSDAGMRNNQILDMTSNVWLNAPSMQQKRAKAACLVTKNTLFAIGGGQDTIEILPLNINHLLSENWVFIDQLSQALDSSRAVKWNDAILVIGGLNADGIPVNDMHIINTITYTVSLGSPLYMASIGAPVVVTSNKFAYAFGGSIDNLKYFQYLNLHPTQNPTLAPSIFPILAPSQTPSISPTVSPSQLTSLIPTPEPSEYALEYQSQFPTPFPILSSIDTAEMMTIYEKKTNQLSNIYQFVLGIFGSFAVLMIMLGIIDAKCVRSNDYFNTAALISATIQILDMTSDCFFCAKMGLLFHNDTSFQIKIALCLSISFIIIPTTISIFQVYRHSKHYWLREDTLRLWLGSYATILLSLSILLGSSFSAVSVLNTNLFRLEYFDMGLTPIQLRQFVSKRVYSVVFFENIPQLCIQLWFILAWEKTFNNPIVVSSILFSFLSIIVSIISMLMQRMIFRTQQRMLITMHVTGKCITMSFTKCRSLNVKLRQSLSELLSINYMLMEIIQPQVIQNGLSLNINIYVNDAMAKKNYFQRIMLNNKKNGTLGNIFKQSWKLQEVPIVSEVKVTTYISKNMIKLIKARSMSSASSNRNGTKSMNQTHDRNHNIFMTPPSHPHLTLNGTITSSHIDADKIEMQSQTSNNAYSTHRQNSIDCGTEIVLQGQNNVLYL